MRKQGGKKDIRDGRGKDGGRMREWEREELKERSRGREEKRDEREKVNLT